MDLLASVQADLDARNAVDTPLGQLALSLAGRLPSAADTAAANIARELRTVLAEIAASAATSQGDQVDELLEARARRRAAAEGS